MSDDYTIDNAIADLDEEQRATLLAMLQYRDEKKLPDEVWSVVEMYLEEHDYRASNFKMPFVEWATARNLMTVKFADRPGADSARDF